MSKKKSIIRFVIYSVLAVIGILLSVCKFDIPFTEKTYNGFANSISLGLDLSGGVLAVYEAKSVEGSEADFNDSLNATIQRLSDLLTEKGYTEATVTKQGSNRIRVEVPDVDDPEEIFDMIGTPAELSFKKENSATAESIITGKHIKKCEASYQNGEYGVSIQFTEEGTKLFSDLTAEMVGKQIYIFLGNSTSAFSSPKVNEQISGGTTFISGSMNSQAEAEAFALKIMSGTFDVELELLENNTVTPTLGEDALKYSIIAGFVGLAFILIFMFVIYRDLGLIADFSLIFYCIILMFLLQAVPFVQLTLPGIAGIILSLGMAVDGNVVIFERIKEEYRNGKSIENACNSGFRHAYISILDSNITTILASIVLVILGTGSIKGFAITLLLGIVVSLFTSLILTKRFMKMYLAINKTNPKKMALKRGIVVDENN